MPTMPEHLFSPFDRKKQLSPREYEADMLVVLNEAIDDVFHFALRAGPVTGFPPDNAPDALAGYCGAVAQRDPSFGRLLVRKLVERSFVDSGDDLPRDGAVEQHWELARNVNDDLVEAGHVQPGWGWLEEEWARKGLTLPRFWD